MKQLATVVRENGRLMAEVIRPEACEACHACKYGRTERRLMALPSGDFREGDQVELNLPDGKVGIASLLAYGIPLIGLVIGLLVPMLLGAGDLWQALGALIGLGLSLILLRTIEPRLKKSGAFLPQAYPCQGDKGTPE